MIYGIGIDMIEIGRIRIKLDKDSGFRGYVFSKDEIEYCESMANKYEHYSARFASKKALLKAMSTGLSSNTVWNNIGVTHNKNGGPIFKFGNMNLSKLLTIENPSIYLSPSHLRSIACAMVNIEFH